jgi:hypothetical protein
MLAGKNPQCQEKEHPQWEHHLAQEPEGDPSAIPAVPMLQMMKTSLKRNRWSSNLRRRRSKIQHQRGRPKRNTRSTYAVGKGHSSRGLRCKPASGSNIGIGSGDQAAARPPTSGDTEHVASATPLRHFTPNTLHKLEPTQSSASDSSNLTMASILQANNIVQVQWKVRPAPIHYELRSSSSLRRGEWICPILIFRHSSGGWCAGLVLYAQAKHSILMGKPLR